MALTIIQVETMLLKRVATLFTAVGLDGTTVDGDNDDLVGPVGYSIRQLGGTVTTITDVVDTDLAGIAVADYDELLDIAELRALQNAYSAATTLIDTKIGPRDEKLGMIADKLAKLVEAKQKAVESMYQLGLAPLQSGVMAFDFAEHNEDSVDTSGW